MRRIVLLCVLFSTCQAPPPSSQVTSKDSSSTSEKIIAALKNTSNQTWRTLKGWYGKTREWFWGPDGFFTTMYHSTGTTPKSIPSRKSCCCRHRPRRNGYSYPYTGSGTTTSSRSYCCIFVSTDPNGDCCPGADCCSGVDCSSCVDCTQVGNCVCGVLSCVCDPNVIGGLFT